MRVRSAALLVILAIVAAACSGGSDSSDAAADSIKVWIMEPGSDDLVKYFEDTTKDFEAANEGTSVDVQFVPWDQAHNQFVTAVGGGQVPAMAEMGTTWNPEFASLGALQPVGGEVEGDYVESLLESASFEGETYGLPWYSGARALIYRSDVFERLDLEVPTTWEEMVQAGRVIRRETNLWPLGVDGTSTHQFLPMIWQNGGEIAVENDGTWEAVVDSPEAVEAIQFYADLWSKEEFSPKGALNWNSVDIRTAVAAGDMAMMVGGAWDYRGILSEAPELESKLGTALLPEGPAGSRDTLAGGSNLVVFREAEGADLARQYAEFLLQPERVNAFANDIGFLPGTVDGIRNSPYFDDEKLRPFAEQLLDHSRNYPAIPEWGTFVEGSGLFQNAVQQVMTGEKTAQEAMSEAASAMNEEFNK